MLITLHLPHLIMVTALSMPLPERLAAWHCTCAATLAKQALLLHGVAVRMIKFSMVVPARCYDHRIYATFLRTGLVSGAPLGSYLVRMSSSSARERPSWRMMSSRHRHVPVRVRLRFELASVSLHDQALVSIL